VVRKKKGLSTGAVVGITLGSIALFFILCFVALNAYVNSPATQDDISITGTSISYGELTGTQLGWTLYLNNESSFKTIRYIAFEVPVVDSSGRVIDTAMGNAGGIPPGASFTVDIVAFGVWDFTGVYADWDNLRVSMR
jgi:hypothetical protein